MARLAPVVVPGVPYCVIQRMDLREGGRVHLWREWVPVLLRGERWPRAKAVPPARRLGSKNRNTTLAKGLRGVVVPALFFRH